MARGRAAVDYSFVWTFDRSIQIGRRKHGIAATEIKNQRRWRLSEFRFRVKDATQKLHCTRRGTRMATNSIAAIPEWLGNTTDAVKKTDRVIGWGHSSHLRDPSGRWVMEMDTIPTDMLATPKALRFHHSPGQCPVVMIGAVSQVIASAGFSKWRRPAAGDNQVALTWIRQRIEQPLIRALDADHANAHHHASLPFSGSSSELSDQGLIGDRPAAFRPTAADRRPGWRIAGGERFHRRFGHNVNCIVG
jgi:hypothetical protein